MIKLRQQTVDEYDSWSKKSRETYTNENIKNGLSPKEAQQKTDDDFNRLLPEGRQSSGQYLFTIVNEISSTNVETIGTLWFGVRGSEVYKKAFIYDIIIDEQYRSKGYGQQAMNLLESEVKKLGLRHIGLHVFGHNTAARAVYEKLGYVMTNLNLEKVI